MVKRLLKWGTACAAIWLAACTDPNAARRQQLAAEMEILTEQISVASQAVEHERDKLTFFESQMRVKEAELADYRGKVNAYLLNHKMALAAIALGVGGTSVAIDTSNEFSQDAQAAASRKSAGSNRTIVLRCLSWPSERNLSKRSTPNI